MKGHPPEVKKRMDGAKNGRFAAYFSPKKAPERAKTVNGRSGTGERRAFLPEKRRGPVSVGATGGGGGHSRGFSVYSSDDDFEKNAVFGNAVKGPGVKLNRGRAAPALRAFLFCAVMFAVPGARLFAQAPLFAVVPDDPRPGDPLTVALAEAPPDEPVYASLYHENGRRLSRARFFYYLSAVRDDGASPVSCWTAVLTVPATAAGGEMTIRLETMNENVTAVLAERRVTIAERRFNAEEIALNQSNTDIRTRPDPVKTAQSDELWAILTRTGNTVYSEGPFVPPVAANTRRTSLFGDRRVYVYSTGARDASIHAGVDYGVPTGTPVQSCARGKVVLAKFRISTGYSVVIEHLPGLYSLYYHLSALNVMEGSIIDAGVKIGESGATGLATGPHLHWEIRAAAENTDPDALVNRAVLDKNLILGKLGLR
jgi:murein DD-endopeptidase MepM/ murein hydrolase activator NlpD